MSSDQRVTDRYESPLNRVLHGRGSSVDKAKVRDAFAALWEYAEVMGIERHAEDGDQVAALIVERVKLAEPRWVHSAELGTGGATRDQL